MGPPKPRPVPAPRPQSAGFTAGSGSGSVEWEFKVAVVDWFREGPGYKFMRDAATLPSYRKIISLGWPVVPLIIDLLRAGSNPTHWEIALASITGASPAGANYLVPTDHDAWRKSWIDWWDTHEANTDAMPSPRHFLKHVMGLSDKDAEEIIAEIAGIPEAKSGELVWVQRERYSLPPIISRRRRIVDSLLLAGTMGAWAAWAYLNLAR